MKTNIKKQAGRPPLPESERRVQRSIRLLPHHWAKIDSAGKAEFEAYLDAWNLPKKKPARGGPA